MKFHQFKGLVAAAPTPMRADGSLNLKPIERLAEYYAQNQLEGVLIAGTQGEGQSLCMEERRRLAAWWSEVTDGSSMKVIVHVGHNSLFEARELAAHAQKTGAFAVAAMSPSFHRPNNVERLTAACQLIAQGAPKLPFYYYHLPAETGVEISMTEFLVFGRKRLSNLAGIHFADGDLAQFQQCLAASEGALDLLFGREELYLGALTMGAQGAVGSSFSVTAPIYQRLLAAYAAGDVATARMEQARAVEFMQTLRHYGYLPACKAVMSMVGVDCGPPRLPLTALSPAQMNALRQDLERIEFFEWIGPYHMHARQPIRTSMAA